MITAQHVKFLPWDSQFFGFNIGQLKSGDLDADKWEEVLQESQDLNLTCLYLLADPADSSAVQQAESYGFRYMDTRLTFSHCQPSSDQEPDQDERIAHRIRVALKQDLPELRAIARDSHHNTRFFADPNFSREDCERLYEVWIENSLTGYAQQVFIAEHKIRLAVEGYITCHLTDEKGKIGLIAVHPSARGQHIGFNLVQIALGWFYKNGADKIEVVTQGGSLPPINLYQKAGFQLSDLKLWFHKWFQQPASGKILIVE